MAFVADRHQLPSKLADAPRPAAGAPVDPWLDLLAALPGVGLGRLLYVACGKRLIDVAASAFLLVMLTPLLLLIPLTIRLDSGGPVIFRQQRVGRDGRPFTLYKFRTMAHRPTDTLQWLDDGTGTLRHKLPDDPRVTRVGRWLRRASLDEIPQLLNILRGDMSLVGPRPELVELVARYEPWQHQRHLVRPGLTGWWQVSGRSDLPMHLHTDLDLYYVQNQSFRLDFEIALRTILVVVRGAGAH